MKPNNIIILEKDGKLFLKLIDLEAIKEFKNNDDFVF